MLKQITSLIFCTVMLLSNPAMANTKLTWEDLIAPGYSAEEIMKRYNFDALEEDDPKREQVLMSMEAEWASAPVNKLLDEKTISLDGFIVPTELDGSQIKEFLLVPFLGACIHVPPPPSNQVVYVTMKDALDIEDIYMPYTITGTLTTDAISSQLAEAGYQLHGSSVKPYEE